MSRIYTYKNKTISKKISYNYYWKIIVVGIYVIGEILYQIYKR
jgi:hypothetical protein